MALRQYFALFFLFLISSSIFASQFSFTQITITNNTALYGSGKLDWSPCSSFITENGVMPPHGSMVIPNEIFNYCQYGCTALLFLSKNCTSHLVATVKLSRAKGVSDIVNNDPTRYLVSGGGMSVVVDPVG